MLTKYHLPYLPVSFIICTHLTLKAKLMTSHKKNESLRLKFTRYTLLIGVLFVATISISLIGARHSPATTLDTSVIKNLPDIDPPKIGDPTGRAEMQDLETVAEQLDITLDEVIERYAWNDDFSMLVGEVRTNHSNAFSYAAINGPDTAEMWFSADAPEEALILLAYFNKYFPNISITVRTGFKITETEINQAVAAAHFAIYNRSEINDASTWFNYEKRQISVVVPYTWPLFSQADLVNLESVASDAAGTKVGEPQSHKITIQVAQSESVILSGEDSSFRHNGGEAISACTSGFGTRTGSPTSGTRGIATAGHCPNSQSDDGSLLTLVDEYDGYFGDFQVHTGPYPETDDFYSGNSTTLEVNLRDLSGFGVATNGQWLCRNGKSSKKDCLQVRKTSVCSGSNCSMLQMNQDKSTGGDSGAPVFWGNTAYGLHEGSMYDPFWPFSRDTVSRADMLHEALPNTYWATS